MAHPTYAALSPLRGMSYLSQKTVFLQHHPDQVTSCSRVHNYPSIPFGYHLHAGIESYSSKVCIFEVHPDSVFLSKIHTINASPPLFPQFTDR